MSCIQPMLVRNNRGSLIRVPCGKCYGCLRRKQRELALRLSHDLEDKTCFDSIFVTLTFDDEHLIIDYIDEETGAFYPLPSITKECLQKFFKRLRKNLGYNPKVTKLAYYATGEYGDHTKRPHAHSIIYLYGVNTCKMPLRDAVKKSWTFCKWDLVNEEKCLQSAIGEGAKMYVAKHQVKKCQGTYLQYPYFQLRSKGIGKLFFSRETDIDFADKNGFLYYDRVKKSPVPRYYREKLSICNITDGEMIAKYNEDSEKDWQQMQRAYKYYKQSHPKITFQDFAHKYFKKLLKDQLYSDEYAKLMYEKFKNSKI